MNQRNVLQEPGAGLPAVERIFLNLALKSGAVFTSPQSALSGFLKDADAILALIDENDIDTLSQQAMIPRMFGIEDSSRNWSVLMVIDHLCLANRTMLNVLSDLLEGQRPLETLSIAALKPSRDTDMLRVEDFRLVNQEIERFVVNRDSLNTDLKHRHPWFGELDGHLWMCLAAAHQRIHRRQCRKILTVLGIV